MALEKVNKSRWGKYQTTSLDTLRNMIVFLGEAHFPHQYCDPSEENPSDREFSRCVQGLIEDNKSPTVKNHHVPGEDYLFLNAHRNFTELKNLLGENATSEYSSFPVTEAQLQTFKQKGWIVLIDGQTDNSNSKGTNMANSVKSTLKTTANKNVQSVAYATQIKLGQFANKSAVKFIKGKVPMMARGYVETPLGSLVVANLVQVAVNQFAPDNKKAVVVADAMLNAAMLEAADLINIDAIVESVFDHLPKDQVDALLKQSESDNE